MNRYPPTKNGTQKTLGSQLDSGETSSMTLNNTTSIQNKPGVVVINRINTDNEELSAGLREYVGYTGVSGSTLTGLTRNVDSSTSDQDHAIGSVVEFIPDVTWAQFIAEALANIVNETTGAIDPTKVLPATYLDTDGTLAANSDAKLPTQKAVKTYADTKAPKANPSFTGTVSVAGAITQSGTADHITFTPGTSKLVKSAVLRQDNTTNTYKNNSIILTGWGFCLGDGSTPATVTKSITFGLTFTEAPTIAVTTLGYKDSSDPSTISDFSATSAYVVSGGAISTSGFTAQGYNLGGSSISNTRRVGFSWVAIGVL